MRAIPRPPTCRAVIEVVPYLAGKLGEGDLFDHAHGAREDVTAIGPQLVDALSQADGACRATAGVMRR